MARFTGSLDVGWVGLLLPRARPVMVMGKMAEACLPPQSVTVRVTLYPVVVPAAGEKVCEGFSAVLLVPSSKVQ